MESYDISVIGAGLAGLHFAQTAAELGCRTLLVDRKDDVGLHVHTSGIFVRKTIEDFAIDEGCLGPWVRDVVLHSPQRRVVALQAPSGEFRVGRMSKLYREKLSHAQAAGVEWRNRTHFVSSESDSAGSIIRVQHGGREYSLRSALLVGADGAASRVAHALGLDENQEWIVGVEDVFESAAGFVTPALHCFVDPRLAPGYIAWVVVDGEEIHVGVGGYADEFDPTRALSEFYAVAADTIGAALGARVERRAGRIPVGGILRRIGTERGLLIGDAAGAPSPLTAGGLDACYRLSQFAVGVALSALSGDRLAMTRSYRGDRFKARFISRCWMRRAMAAVRNRSLIEAAFAALSTPLLRGLAWQVFFGRASFPDVEQDAAIEVRADDVRRRRFSTQGLN
jgi:flavin-dependent dehydrogenase